MTTNVYVLRRSAGNNDEWFSSLFAAKTRRREVIAEEDFDEFGDLSIDKTRVVPFPRKKLILALLNGRGWASGFKEVVPPYRSPPPRRSRG